MTKRHWLLVGLVSLCLSLAGASWGLQACRKGKVAALEACIIPKLWLILWGLWSL